MEIKIWTSDYENRNKRLHALIYSKEKRERSSILRVWREREKKERVCVCAIQKKKEKFTNLFFSTFAEFVFDREWKIYRKNVFLKKYIFVCENLT